MRKNREGKIIYSPSDLIVFMESGFASWMDRFSLESPEKIAFNEQDENLKILQSMGIKHELAYLENLRDSGLEVKEIANTADAIFQTSAAMKSGWDVIYQAELLHDEFAGRADFLIKTPGLSALGDHHYEVWDTKLSRSTKAYFIIQLCCYTEMVTAMQLKQPDYAGVVLGDNSLKKIRLEDYFFYYQRLKNRFKKFQLAFDISNRPIPDGMESHGRWSDYAEQILNELNHLSLIANIRKAHIEKLQKCDLNSVEDVAKTTIEHIKGLKPETFTILRNQARLQELSKMEARPRYELIEVRSNGNRYRGLKALSPACANDVYFDMESYPYVEGGLEYLFGASTYEDGKLVFKAFWAHDREQEKRSFESFIDWITKRWHDDNSMHVYHYGDYEISALRRLMSRHATRELELDHLLRNGVFINLFTVLRQSMLVGTPSYSIKKIERLYRAQRNMDVASAIDSVVFYHHWRENPDGTDPSTSPILQKIQDYNQDDCDSTAQLAEWLRDVQRSNEICWSAPTTATTPSNVSSKVHETLKPLIDLSKDLLENLPTDAEKSRVQRLLAYLLLFHWRESKPIFWAKYDRQKMSDDQLIEDPSCFGGLTRSESPPRPEKRSFAYEYKFSTPQDSKLDVGDKCFFAHELGLKTEILTIDHERGRLEIKIGAKTPALPDTIGLIPDEYVDAKVISESIFRTVAKWKSSGELRPAVESILYRKRPSILGIGTQGPVLKPAADRISSIIATVKSLESSALCIQGPPGSGKTYTATKIIIELLMAGKRVGVTSNSHKAIAKLLKDVETESKKIGFKVQGSKIQSEEEDFHLDGTGFAASKSVDYVFGAGRSRFNLVGGTAWSFSEKAAVDGFDYLFVEEAGQVSLANLIAVAPSAENIILIGDQMQLSQPMKGTHPEESGQSSLQYLVQDQQAVPADFGIFLDKSFRMHPDVCKFVSEAIYEGRLVADDVASTRHIVISSNNRYLEKSTGIAYYEVEHQGNIQSSIQEAEMISKLITELLTCKISENGIERPFSKEDILVVTPYNMQVKELNSRHLNALVGTVDKFQGQEAAVVIVSMASSESSASVRGVEFLFNKNRLNVAISRAKCLALVVASTGLVDSECTSVSQMETVNLYCRLIDFAQNSSGSSSKTELI
jgi:predicted RecB family nuclease